MNTDGGPAFPVPDTHHPDGQIQYGANGMSLRDWFAGQALAGMLSAFAKQASKGGPARFAEANCDTAYDIADAMLRARERGREGGGQ